MTYLSSVITLECIIFQFLLIGSFLDQPLANRTSHWLTYDQSMLSRLQLPRATIQCPRSTDEHPWLHFQRLALNIKIASIDQASLKCYFSSFSRCFLYSNGGYIIQKFCIFPFHPKFHQNTHDYNKNKRKVNAIHYSMHNTHETCIFSISTRICAYNKFKSSNPLQSERPTCLYATEFSIHPSISPYQAINKLPE